jgi:hypothetical protein
LTEFVPVDAGGEFFNFFVRAFPDGKGASEKSASIVREDEDAASAVIGIPGDLQKAAALKRFKGSGQSSAVHCEKRSHGPHGWWLRAVEGHQERKLPIGQFEGTKLFVEAPCEGASCTLHVETETSVFNHQRCFERQRLCT